MVQIFINEVELDLPANIGEQIAINFEAFPLGEFRNTFNNFSGNLTFPATPKNCKVFGQATNNLSPLTITRQYTGQILSGAIELFYGRVDFERYNNGFECRFVTSGQLLSEQIKQYDMFDVMYGLRRADLETGETWFDHRYLATATQNGIGTNQDSGFNVYYPLLDLGYFNNTNKKIGFFDLRACFNLWTMCLAIAKKVNKTMAFNGAVPSRLVNTFITPKEWKYSDRLIQENTSSAEISKTSITATRNLSGMFGEDNGLLFVQNLDNNIYNINVTRELSPPQRTYFNFQSSFAFNAKITFAIGFQIRVANLLWINSGSGIQCVDYLFEFITPYDFDKLNPVITLVGESNSGFSNINPSGLAPEVSVNSAGSSNQIMQFMLRIYANEAGFSPNGTTDAYANVNISFSTEKLIPEHNNQTIIWVRGVSRGRYPTGTLGQGNVTSTFAVRPHTEIPKVISILHDERIYANGLISGADLMGSLKPADMLKYAMRLTGSYLIETDRSITLVPFSDYDKATAMDWSGKVNWLIPPIVDYRDNELGKNNYLIYKQDDSNTSLDPYYLAGNLPTNLGDKDVILFEAPFAQSAFNPTFQGALSLVRVPFYDTPLAYIYRVWIDNATPYVVGQYVGYLGRLFKVLNNCLGSDGSPIVNTADYEEVDYSIFNQQSIEYRAIEVLTGQVTNVEVYNDFGDLQYTNSIVGALNGIDFQKAITDGYGFIPSTFLDYRQVVCQVSLSDLDIHLLDLKKLVFISELNAYFYINKVEDYTPDTNVDTTVTLTMLP